MKADEPIRRLEMIRGPGFESICIVELNRIAGRERCSRPRPPLNVVDIVWTQKSPSVDGDYSLSVGAQTVNVHYSYSRGVWMGTTYTPSLARLKAYPQAVFNSWRPRSANAA